MQEVRDLGRYPKEYAGRSPAEWQLAVKLRKALQAKKFSHEQEAELEALRHASPKQEEKLMQQVSASRAEDSARRAEELMQQVRDIGRYPRESRHGSAAQLTQSGLS